MGTNTIKPKLVAQAVDGRGTSSIYEAYTTTNRIKKLVFFVELMNRNFVSLPALFRSSCCLLKLILIVAIIIIAPVPSLSHLPETVSSLSVFPKQRDVFRNIFSDIKIYGFRSFASRLRLSMVDLFFLPTATAHRVRPKVFWSSLCRMLSLLQLVLRVEREKKENTKTAKRNRNNR